jgi:hypothetical protein
MDRVGLSWVGGEGLGFTGWDSRLTVAAGRGR